MPNDARKIIHIDMDAFYASVEQLDHPEWRGLPLVVGGGEKGVVAAASYEARKFGIRSAMSGKIALQKCKDLIVVKPRFARYKEISEQIHAIFHEYTDLVEPLSLDEAYLDVTENKMNIISANDIAKEIRQKIFERTGLTASAGISNNKFLAKIASDVRKPNGQKTIHPSEVEKFMDQLPIEKFYGIGKVTAKKMHQLHIYKGKDLKQFTLKQLQQMFGKSGDYYYNVARGIHHSEVKPNRIRKSIAVENTFWDNLYDEQDIIQELHNINEKLFERSVSKNIKGKTLTLKIKYEDFSVFTRSKTKDFYYETIEETKQIITELWQLRPQDKPVRLLGLSFSNLNTEPRKETFIQLKIPFIDYE